MRSDATTMEPREEFGERYVRAIMELPQDAKVLCEIVDDEDVPEEGRALVAGALVSLLQPGDLIPDTWGPLCRADDAITLRLAVAQALPEGQPAREPHAKRFAAFFGELADDLAAARALLGDTFALFEQRLGRLPNLEHKGKRAATLIRTEATRGWLYDEVDEAMTDLEIDEDELNVAMRRIDPLLTHLKRRLTHR